MTQYEGRRLQIPAPHRAGRDRKEPAPPRRAGRAKSSTGPEPSGLAPYSFSVAGGHPQIALSSFFMNEVSANFVL
jgi:hypothetical protein